MGGIAVVIDGIAPPPPDFAELPASRFCPTDPPTLLLHASPTDEPLRPAGAARAEQDSWAGFEQGDTVSIAIKIPGYSPAEVLRVDLPSGGLEGRLLHRTDLHIAQLTYPLDQLLLTHALAIRGGVLMHGAAIAGPNGGFLVAGPSGAGKTTMARAAHGLPGARVLSDERSVVRPTADGWVIDGTPWYGEGQFAERATVPLRGVMWLEKSDRDEIAPMAGARALANLYRCHFAPYWSTANAERTLDNLERLVREVPVHLLRNRQGGDGARMLLERLGA
ncbi:MAG TPA: hypothetical protein VFF06_34045 [Polyangia bacterium]|nr:hypothetical protein [Polyangia bacterium]